MATGLCPFISKRDTPRSRTEQSSATQAPWEKAVFTPFFPLLLVIYNTMCIAGFQRFVLIVIYHAEILDTMSVQTQDTGNISKLPSHFQQQTRVMNVSKPTHPYLILKSSSASFDYVLGPCGQLFGASSQLQCLETNTSHRDSSTSRAGVCVEALASLMSHCIIVIFLFA